ncbi:hypothetical protein AA0498_1220 [Acidomonas methanolica]|uniref:Uncharacterized protein n=1 Tax=Acidomonas methanolica NBRC 104435 TaxID=1231351 RepID=A0A023D1B2_ACIMT|nr:hypothetical protein Amme_011_022 [Acidomonas methanolica NBRC 104435]GBQ50483.1 hypothetical protein AA0498_1220 [Acidomonas methanolica]GEK98541.1 hypothetical protein AME01nite_10400 [Acidomonas methanolica NBRC 104435]
MSGGGVLISARVTGDGGTGEDDERHAEGEKGQDDVHHDETVPISRESMTGSRTPSVFIWRDIALL